MRNRKEFEKAMNSHLEMCWKNGLNAGYNDFIIELLLDIRELLITNSALKEEKE